MLLTMVRRSLRRQVRRRGLIAATVALATSVSVAMLGVVFDVGDKLSAELTAYGSNIVVQPKADAIISDALNFEISSPSKTIDPDFGSRSRTMVLAVVDLPHPDSPTRLNTSPRRTAKETPLTA